MFDFFLPILTRVLLGTSPAPAPAHTHQIVTLVPLAGAPGANAVNANSVVDNVQKFYANIKQVTASFRQAVTNDTFGSTKTSDGTVWIMKPGKMRWDYIEKKKGKFEVKKSFISNGTNLYVVEHENMQVVTKNLQQDLMPVAVSFLYGKGDLKTEFTAELDTTGKYGAKGDYVLKMKPNKSSAQYKNLILVVNPSDFRVTQSVIIDSSNNINHFRFFEPDFQKPIQDKWFEFDKKTAPNYRIIDADAQGNTPAVPVKKP
ncbi:MAG: outer membrane lipoprotein carrier protein LolA [Kofleriaceae bacterium]